MSIDLRTINTYDNSAVAMASHFNNYKSGVTKEEIGVAFSVANPPFGTVVEIGCGAGKDAAEIASYCQDYVGFDPSEKLLNIAQQANPTLRFMQNDALSFMYPSGLTAVFAFASLLHLDKDDFVAVCKK